MTTFTVTTANDIIDAGDGALSLREAVAAATGVGDSIVFANTLNDSTIALSLGQLSVLAGRNISINGDVDGDGSADVTLLTTTGSAAISIAATAEVTIDSVKFSSTAVILGTASNGGAGTIGAYGGDGANGPDALPGSLQDGGSGISGGTGGDGGAGQAGGNGGNAVGAIINAGVLTLKDSSFVMAALSAGNGGNGGDGGSAGAGGNGGSGGIGSSGNSGNGGFGGSGGNGGSGGTGGAGGAGGEGGFAAAVANLGGGTLNLGVNAFISAGYSGGTGGTGGVGGLGGNGGNGSDGGAGGNGSVDEAGIGGDGGNGGSGGNGGDNGFAGTGGNGGAAAPIINYGTLNWWEQSLFQTVIAAGGAAGTGGADIFSNSSGGFFGGGGAAGGGAVLGNGGSAGIAGTAGNNPGPGAAGASGPASVSHVNFGTLNNTASADTLNASMLYFGIENRNAAETGDAGAFTVTVTFNRIGNLSGAVEAGYIVNLSGTDPGNAESEDFAGLPPILSGTVFFAAGEDTTSTTLTLFNDNFAEGNEQFSVWYTGVIAGSASWATPYTTITLVDDDNGTAASETLNGSASSDNISGLGGIDIIRGNGGNDTLSGGADADQIDGGTGNDIMRGDGGDDLFFVDSEFDQVFESAAGGTADRVLASVNYTLAFDQQIELFTTTNGAGVTAINLTGNNLVNDIAGNNGANIINGGGGADRLRGLGGNDLYYVDNALDTVLESAGNGTADRVLTSVDYTLGVNQEIELFSTTNSAGATAINLTGNNLANTILGNNGANIINGGAGIDRMTGLNGNDLYYVDNFSDVVVESAGGGTADRVLTSVNYILADNQQIELFSTTNSTGVTAINLVGNNLANRILGNNGANVMGGGLGNDVMTGGLGADQFRFSTAIAGGGNVDTITDFVHLTDDIQLAQSIFTGIGGTLDVSELRLGTTATTATQRIVYDSVTGNLFFDADGSSAGAQVQFAKVTAGTVLDVNDFIMV